MSEIVIKKVKVIPKQGKIQIAYFLNGDDMSGMFTEPAAPELYDCFKELREAVLEMLELPEIMRERITPFGVSYGHGNDVTRASIAARLVCPISETETVVNTPTRKVSAEYEDGLELSTCQTLTQLEDEARKYLQGQRAQMNLFNAEDLHPRTVVNITPADEPKAIAAGE